MAEQEIEDLKKQCELADDVIRKVYRYSENPCAVTELPLSKALETYNNFLETIGQPINFNE